MGVNYRLVSTSLTGLGGGQYLVLANALSPAWQEPVSARTIDRPAASTADYYHTDGLTDLRAWDLLAMGSHGAALAASTGYRYVWLVEHDHGGNSAGTGGGGWNPDGTTTYSGYSNDPHIFPEASTLRAIIPQINSMPGSTGTFSGFNSWLVYNPDDPDDDVFYIYKEGGCQSGDGGATPGSYTNALNMVLYKNSDFDTDFTPVGVSHACEGQFGMTAYQRVYRNGTGDWESWGGGNTTGNDGSIAKWTSTDGLEFTIGALTKRWVNNLGVAATNGTNSVRSYGTMAERFQIGSDWYLPMGESRLGRGWSSGTTYALDARVNMGNVNEIPITYKSLQASNTNHNPESSPDWWENLGNLGSSVVLMPIDNSTGDIDVSGTPPMITISNKYAHSYPESSFLQYIHSYLEDGVLTIYAIHGFFNDTGIQSAKLYADGGGIDEQYVDVYAYVVDATAAQASAPFGVKAHCIDGVVTLSWHDLPAGRTYRIKRGTDGATFGTTVGDVTGTTTTDNPTVGSVYYYEVTSLHGGVEQASRVVSTYVS